MQVTSKEIFVGFDVGGSTTDILCVALRRREPGSSDAPRTLIKEGSIRISAGILADATKRSDTFQDVLRRFCLANNEMIHGVTVPPNRLNKATASYYFNLLMDRLDSPRKLKLLYQDIAESCPELFVLNAYMTGLIMFHAGQLSAVVRKIQADEPDSFLEPFRRVTIGCFGKGGRMFDWLPAALGEGSAERYFEACFALGFEGAGGGEIDGLQIRYSVPEMAKAEVSFGLASDRELETAGTSVHELIGEVGYALDGTALEELSPVDPSLLRNLGAQFQVPDDFPRFGEFAKLFRTFSKEHFGVSLSGIEEDIRRMPFVSYVRNLAEYQAALKEEAKGEDFGFEAPLIILQGLCFLDEVLLKKLFP
jgi:hypothetical protein